MTRPYLPSIKHIYTHESGMIHESKYYFRQHCYGPTSQQKPGSRRRYGEANPPTTTYFSPKSGYSYNKRNERMLDITEDYVKFMLNQINTQCNTLALYIKH